MPKRVSGSLGAKIRGGSTVQNGKAARQVLHVLACEQVKTKTEKGCVLNISSSTPAPGDDGGI
jgi:hypothetical protein